MPTVELTGPPPLAPLYRRAVLTSLSRSRRAGTSTLAPPELVLRGVAVDRDRLARYDRVCGFRLGDPLPATYPQVLAFGLTMRLMTGPGFPLPLVGLIHLANRIEVRRPLTADDRLDFRVRAADLRPHERGRQLDVLVEAYLGDQPVWLSRATYLQRQRGRQPGGSRPDEPPAPAPPPGPVLWRVGPRTGQAYAAVSGDRNPIHTSRTAARLFGFRRPIAHGMWTLARCLAGLQGRLPDAYRVEVAFRAPILLPSTVAFYARTDRPGSWRLAVTSARSGREHLTGTVTPG